MKPFTIGAQNTMINADPALYRKAFEQHSHLQFNGIFEPDLLEKLLQLSKNATFVEDVVNGIGIREIEAPQRVGAAISLMLGRFDWLEWIEAATGITPLSATMGRIVQNRANGRDSLVWHDDMVNDHRKLGLVVNLSDKPFGGGDFEMRRKGEMAAFHRSKYSQAGEMMVFAVNRTIEHRVNPVTEGGPRRVYAGWALSEPEHAGDPLVRRPMN